ncbi:hypothetical protein ACWDXD_33420 [Streptomyces sp. NPDC003314]
MTEQTACPHTNDGHRTEAALTPAPCRSDKACFDCRYWQERADWAANGDQTPAGISPGVLARVNGQHYTIAPMNTDSPAHFLGFGGAQVTFRFHDGREITSNDVWSQGEIPAWWRDRLPDNAVIASIKPRSA